MKRIQLMICAACCLAILVLSACAGNTPAPLTNQAASSNVNTTRETASATSSPAAASGMKAAPSSGGDAIDTSRYDEEIKRLENQHKDSGDVTARLALAKAYLARAQALTQVRQYRAALGDYRRTLRYDPNNNEARQMSGVIISILQERGREVPPEGQEPTPLPFNSGTNASSHSPLTMEGTSPAHKKP